MICKLENNFGTEIYVHIYINIYIILKTEASYSTVKRV